MNLINNKIKQYAGGNWSSNQFVKRKTRIPDSLFLEVPKHKSRRKKRRISLEDQYYSCPFCHSALPLKVNRMKQQPIFFMLWVISLLFIWPGQMAADIFRFKDGSELEGEIVKREGNNLVIRFSFGTTTFREDEIVDIKKSVPRTQINVSKSAATNQFKWKDQGEDALPAETAPMSIQARANNSSNTSLPQAMKAVAFIEVVEKGGEKKYGSGAIINANGTMLTNDHVIEDAAEIFVTLYEENKSKYQSERKYEARVIKSNGYYDLALIDIHANTPDFLRFADKTPGVGDEVKAIGNPAGLQVTTSKGIVSAIRTNRDMNVEYKKVSDDYIGEREFEEITWVQTDTAINPGNSGGPLLNQNNEIIGINTSGYLGWEGLNFALHVKHLKKFSAGYSGKS